MTELKLLPGGKGTLAARAEAAAWITRLHGPNRTPEMEAGFRRWLAERPENTREFEGLTEVWDQVGDLPARAAPRTRRWNHATPRIWARAAAVLLACGLAALGAYQFWFAPYYTTAVGEQRIVLLEDGTRVTLNSNTRLHKAYEDAERRVDLQRGEAYFEVIHNATRPFRVIAGEHQVTAIGTSFVVRYEPDRTAVTLVEGKVVVDTVPQQSQAASVTLEPGERLVLTAARIEQVDRPRVEALTAWRRGEVVLNDTPLSEAVAEMNRYNETPILIDGTAIAMLPVSGLYHTGDSKGFAVTVARLHGLDVDERGGSIHIRAR